VDYEDTPLEDLGSTPVATQPETKSNGEESKFPPAKSEIADQQAALKLLEHFRPDKWISNDEKVSIPGGAESFSMNYLLGNRIPAQWLDLLRAYGELCMGLTTIAAEITSPGMMKVTVWGSEAFQWKPKGRRVLVLPEASMDMIAKGLTQDSLISALRALAYVKEVREQLPETASADQCNVGKTPLMHLYFAATMNIALMVAYIAHTALSESKRLSPGSPMVLLISAPIQQKKQHSPQKQKKDDKYHRRPSSSSPRKPSYHSRQNRYFIPPSQQQMPQFRKVSVDRLHQLPQFVYLPYYPAEDNTRHQHRRSRE